MANIELKSFKVDSDLEQAIEDFVNGPAADFEIVSSFGPVVNPSDGHQYVFLIFRQGEGN